MADYPDHALKVFGTPERELRRRLLHPFRITPPVEEPDTDLDAQEEAPVPSPEPDQITTTTTSWTDFIIGLFYHLTAVAFFSYIKIETDTVLNRLKEERDFIIPESDTYGGMWKFIGHLNFHALAGYFFLALICDLLPWMKRELRDFLDFIFTTTIFPCAMAVTVLFWTMTTCVREYGVETDPMSAMLELPPHLNHGWHSAVGFAVVIEVLLVRHLYPSSSDALKTMFIWNCCHTLWVFWCYYFAAVPYPLLGPYSLPIFFALIYIANIIFYFFGKALSSWSWAE